MYLLNGQWEVRLADGTRGRMELPGTLDEGGIGHRDTGANSWHPDASIGNSDQAFDPDAPIGTRFTRKVTYEGAAYLTRRIDFVPPAGRRVFLEAERARCLSLLVDGRPVPDFVEPSISTPHIFEVTGLLNGDNELTLISDNSYPGLPHDAIVFSSAATDETQTNWNGVLGQLCLWTEETVFLSQVSVYPKGDKVTVALEISAAEAFEGTVTLQSQIFGSAGSVVRRLSLPRGESRILVEQLQLADDVRRWDEYEGNLYTLTAQLSNGSTRRVRFGIRDFGDNGAGRLALNGRPVFLRSEANCAEFPETGYPPMETEAWCHILKLYRAYGVNCVRFHSHCPPEAAFEAADELGMMMQPELSHWNPKNAFSPDVDYAYFRTELMQILRMLANHPSFVMLTLGNELWPDETGDGRMDELLAAARAFDGTRLYANGSNVKYALSGCDPDSDFYTSQAYYDAPLRGTFAGMPELSSETSGSGGQDSQKIRMKGYLNNQYPNAMTSYDASMERLRETYRKPVFSFEAGQFEVLPDFDELEEFHGISDPANLRLIRDRVEKNGLTEEWKRYVEATGELALIGYREEIEAAMRTRELSGISLLSLQDFPGQGTALVGMMNSHLQPKPFDFARPERFGRFFRAQLPLLYLPRYTWETDETLCAELKIANFGRKELRGCPRWQLGSGTAAKGQTAQADCISEYSGVLPEIVCPPGVITDAGTVALRLERLQSPCRLNLTVALEDAENTYPVWVYPPVIPVCPDSVYETPTFDEKARKVLAGGGTVYLAPPSDAEHLPHSIQAQFTTDFWSVGTFSTQEGGMGQLIQLDHPVFADFPTEFHTNWQWWPMASQRAVILPTGVKSIVTEMDSYAYMRNMSQLLECRCGGGRLLFSSFGLQELQQYPEARALQSSIYRYLVSDKFQPEQELTPETVAGLVRETI